MSISKILILFMLLSTTTAFGQDGQNCACGHSEPSNAQTMQMQHKMSMPNNGSHAMVKLPTIQCGLCKARIEGALIKSPGVLSIDVDVETKMAHINYDSEKTTQAMIEEAITMLGYQANKSLANQEAYKKLPACCKIQM